MNWLRNNNEKKKMSNKSSRVSRYDLQEMLKRIDRAYRIVDLNDEQGEKEEEEPMIFQRCKKGAV